MPELPEVQTIVDDLRKSIRGWKVADFSSSWEKNISSGLRNFEKNIIRAKITGVKRKGKYILIELDNGNVIVVHLRMTGALLAQAKSSKLKVQSKTQKNLEKKHIRHWWLLKRGSKELTLYFSDVRKFGTIDLLIQNKYATHKGLCKLGSDPLSKKFTSEHLKKILQKYPKRPIRAILLDQCLIAGIGNIYASEILFDAKIAPKRTVGEIKPKEIETLCRSMKKVLKKAIQLRGTSISDYRDSSGKKGSFQKILKVYNREHKPCLRRGCGGVVAKEKLQQRSSYWCPKCQV